MAYVAEGKCIGFPSLYVLRRSDYRGSYWPLLREVEIKLAWNNTLMIFWPLYIDITADPRCGTGWLLFWNLQMIPTSPRPLYQTALKVAVSKWKCLFAEITDASVVSGFTENWLVCTAKTCLDLATHWCIEKRDNSVMFLPLLFP